METWTLVKTCLCRCCHTEGTSYTSLESKCFWLGDKEQQYDRILKECFDIELAPVSSLVKGLLATICQKCIDKLRDATVFKHQVKKCEQMFRKIYMDGYDKDDVPEDIIIKQEEQDGSDEEVFKVVTEDVPNLQAHSDDRDDRDDDDDDERINGDCIEEASDEEKTEEPQQKTAKKGKRKVGRAKKVKEDKKGGTEESESAKKTKTGNRPTTLVIEGTDYKRLVKQSGVFLQCCICYKEWEQRNLELLRSHVRYVHKKHPRYVCAICGKTYLMEKPYTKHKYEEHNIDDRYKCTACDKVYYSKAYLTTHYNSFHMLGRKLKCDLCDYETYLRSRLKRHKDKHKTVKDYHCSYCDKSFVRRNTLNYHERIHTGDKRKVCKVCGQAFVQKASLNYHMAKYHPGVDF